MESPLPLDCELVVEEGHQLQLAAPDRAPQRDAAQRLGLAAGQAPQQAAAPGHRFEFGLQLAEPLGRGALFGIGAKLARRDERVIGRKDGGHLLPLRIVPAKLSAIWPSSSPCTTSPRRKISRPVSRTSSTTASSGSPMRPAPTNCVDRSSVTEWPALSDRTGARRRTARCRRADRKSTRLNSSH